MKKHILIIDDSKVEIFIAQHIINKKKISEKISTFTTVEESLTYLKSIDNLEEFPDLIFLDINMPVLNGFDFLDLFLQFPNEFQAQCEVIMLTSSEDPKDKDRAMKYSVVKDYFIKPLKSTDLDCFQS